MFETTYTHHRRYIEYKINTIFFKWCLKLTLQNYVIWFVWLFWFQIIQIVRHLIPFLVPCKPVQLRIHSFFLLFCCILLSCQCWFLSYKVRMFLTSMLTMTLDIIQVKPPKMKWNVETKCGNGTLAYKIVGRLLSSQLKLKSCQKKKEFLDQEELQWTI